MPKYIRGLLCDHKLTVIFKTKGKGFNQEYSHYLYCDICKQEERKIWLNDTSLTNIMTDNNTCHAQQSPITAPANGGTR